jgi:hypothetical protein
MQCTPGAISQQPFVMLPCLLLLIEPIDTAVVKDTRYLGSRSLAK